MSLFMPSMKTAPTTKVGNQVLDRVAETTAFSEVFGNLGNKPEESALPLTEDLLQTGELLPESRVEEMRDVLANLDPLLLEELLTKLIAESEPVGETLHTLEVMLANISNGGIPVLELASEDILAEMFQKYEELQLLEQSKVDSENNLKQYPFEFQTIIDLKANFAVGKLTAEQAQEKLQELYSKVEALLQQVHSQTDMKRVAPKLLTFLQEWQQLLPKATTPLGNQPQLNLENKQLADVWQNLVQAYEKRMGMTQRHHYNLDAKVSTHEIVRWLGNALEANVNVDKVVQPPVTNVNMPISKVEQFVIHMNQTQSHTQQSADKQLIEQFQKIMDASRISSLQNNRGQLAITLKPVNLGEMIVRFTQVNGEMIVKILVTTDVAKSMLEGNMQQLRGMFSPQQVVVEKQELNLTQSQEAQNDEASTEHEDRNEEQQTSANDQQRQEDDSFATIFEDLVLNEKV